MNHRTNQTLRPSLIDTEGDLDKAMIEGIYYCKDARNYIADLNIIYQELGKINNGWYIVL